jgi:hypothetical protein
VNVTDGRFASAYNAAHAAALAALRWHGYQLCTLVPSLIADVQVLMEQ